MEKNSKAKKLIQQLLLHADVKINGERPWDIQVFNEGFYSRVLKNGSVGLGEAYMDGWWDAGKLDEFFEHVLRARIDKKIIGDWKMLLHILSFILFNHQRRSKSVEVGEKHYDIGNDLYGAMLDDRKVYTCGYWNWQDGRAKNLDEAQEAKLDLVCKKIGLKPGQRVLDIGCGWGSFAKFAAEKYGAIVEGVTISKEQIAWGNELCAGLPVKLHFKDYREIEGTFDHIVSLGMFEHVGCKNYRTYMEIVARHLKDDGLFLLQTVGTNVSTTSTDPWIMKYIFPNGMLPSIKQIGDAIENKLVMEDWQNFSTDYEKTILAWFENFNYAWPQLEKKYGKRFYRMWKYYLLGAATTFRVRDNQLWQIVFSKHGFPGGYKSVR